MYGCMEEALRLVQRVTTSTTPTRLHVREAGMSSGCL